jgi:FkbM family methyltransferase
MLHPDSETHPRLRSLTRRVLTVPFARTAARQAARFAIQRVPLSRKNKQRIYNLLAADTASGDPVVCHVTTPRGGWLALELNLNDGLSREWYYWGYEHYERCTVRLWTRLLRDAATVFDIGANIGLYSLLAAGRLKERGAIHSFEPNPEVFTWLARNVDLNCFRNAHVSRLALADSNGQANFFLPTNRAWTNGSLVQGFTDQTDVLVVKTMRFDTYCREFGIKKVDLIKIDTEGAEVKVLTGMGELLRVWKPDIVCEVLDSYASALNVFFQSTTYRKFLITSNGLQEMTSLCPHREFRDYYLSCAPVMDAELC